MVQLSLFAPIMFLTAALCLLLASRVWAKRATAGGIYLFYLLLAMGFWSVFNGLQAMVTPLHLILLMSALQYPFLLSIAPLFLLFAVSFVRRQTLQLSLPVAALWLIPLLTLGLVWTDGLFHLYYTEVYTQETLFGTVGIFETGPAMNLTVGYSYALLILGAGILLASMRRASRAHRLQVVVMVAAMGVPLLGNMLYVALEPLPGVDFSPLLFSVSGGLIVWISNRYGFLKVVPLAHDLMFANLSDGVVVLDENRRVADVNGKAREIYQPVESRLGQPVERLLRGTPELLELFSEPGPEHREVVLQTGPEERWYEVSLMAVKDKHNRQHGWLLLYKNIQERKEIERQIELDAASIRLLNEITEAALAEPDLRSMIQVLADRMGELIQGDACFITLWDDERHRTIPAAASGVYRDTYPTCSSIDDGRTLTRSVLEAGKTLMIEDVYTSPHIDPDIALQYTSRSVLGIPMLAGERWLGAVIFGFKRPRLFSEDETRRAEAGARHISLAITKMRLLEEANNRAAQLQALNRVGTLITSGLEASTVIRQVFEHCRQVFDMDVFYLALYEESRDEVRYPILYARGGYISQESFRLSGYAGLIGHVLRSRESLFLHDITDPGLDLPFKAVCLTGTAVRAVIAVPMIHDDRVLGVISVQSNRPYAYRSEHRYLLETLAAQAVVALENARLYSEVMRLSTIDELTGLYNYRSLVELGRREVDRALRFARPLSALFFDVDHFREFNNRFSHAVGNQVLISLAACARENLRAVDLIFRYGGEEFVALLPETELETAVQVGERLRGAVEKMHIPSRGAELCVTISVGVAELAADMHDLEALLAEADGAEKRAKYMGRNRVEV